MVEASETAETAKTGRQDTSLYIPCYNAAATIAACLEGALNQTSPPAEILVVDDGSRDRTLEIASQYPVRIIRHAANRGLAAARNTGVRNASRDLVASLDADCVPDTAWLDRLVRHLEDRCIAAAGGRLVESMQVTNADRWRKAHMTQDWGETLLVDPPFMFGNNAIIRKTAIEDCGWYDEQLRTNGEDAAMSGKLRARGYKTVYDPSAVVSHLRRDDTPSILNMVWRYRVYGSQRFRNGAAAGAVARSWYAHLGGNVRFLQQDLVHRRFELLGIDLLLFACTPYFDLRHVWQAWR